MRILRYNKSGEPHSLGRLGLMVGAETIAHLRACYARYLVEVEKDSQGREIAALRFPPHIAPFLQLGSAAWRAAETVKPWIEQLAAKDIDAAGLDDEPLFQRFGDSYVHIATRPPSKLICVRWDHGASSNVLPPMSLKSSGSVMGPQRKIVKPLDADELCGTAALGVVIGRKCKGVSEANAREAIAGFTVVNDIVAADAERAGRAAGVPGLGDLYDTLTPIGPWLVSKDEVANPDHLRVTTRINGQVFRSGSTRNPNWSVAKLVSFASRTTLEPGDLIAVHAGYDAGTPVRALKPGDVVECEIESIGKIDAQVIDESAAKAGH